MATKRDQLQAHRFLVQRVISALVTREADPEQPPFRRPSTAAFGSVGLAVLVLVGFGVFGLLVPGGNNAWRDGESVIVEKETGTRFVYREGRLHPVRNYTSALLLVGQHAPLLTVSRDSLRDVPRGPLLGIADAPDALPGTDRLLSGGWSLCSQPGPDRTGSTVDESVLLVGEEPSGADPGDGALLVEVPETGELYLIRNGYRHRISRPDVVTVGQALQSEPRARVGVAFVDVLPAGDAIAPITVPGNGEKSTAVPGRPDVRAGQVFVAETSAGNQYYLAETDRLRSISQFQYDIQLTFAPTAAAYDGGRPAGLRLSLFEAAQSRQEQRPAPKPGDAPERRPEFARSGLGPVCAVFSPGSPMPRLVVDPSLPAPDPLSVTPRRSDQGTPLADRVRVAPGSAALVEVMPSADAPVGTVAVVSDQGRLHPLDNREIARVLGYEGVTPVRMPAALVARIPLGSGLAPKAALAR